MRCQVSRRKLKTHQSWYIAGIILAMCMCMCELYLFSDTITRSAMFCAILTIIDRWKSEGVIDIFQVIKDMRIPKPLAVPKSVSLNYIAS